MLFSLRRHWNSIVAMVWTSSEFRVWQNSLNFVALVSENKIGGSDPSSVCSGREEVSSPDSREEACGED